MAKPFLTPQTRQALATAVETVEAESSAELVVAVRERSASPLPVALIAGAAAGYAILAVMLYTPWELGIPWFLLDPLLAGLLAGWVVWRSGWMLRLVTPRVVRRKMVEAAARATFVELGVHTTTGRTGILFFISLAEREVVVVEDVGVSALEKTAAWRQAVAGIAAEVRRGGDGAAVAAKVEGLAPLLAPALVRSHDDVDELANEVR
jgi:putative membrane protein